MGEVPLRAKQPVQPRYELKYLAPASRAPLLRKVISGVCHTDRDYATNRIHSIYYDTPQLHSYEQNLAGLFSRSKVRVRWYGDVGQVRSLPVDSAWAEVKIREGSTGWKERERLEFERPMSTLQEFLPLSSRAAQGCCAHFLVPVCWISYSRTRFVSLHDGTRISVDWGLSARWLHPSMPVRITECTLDRTIVEVKGPSDRPSPHVLASLAGHARRRSFSKYSNFVAKFLGGRD